MNLGVGEAICRVGTRDADFNLRTERLDPIEPETARLKFESIRRSSADRWGTRDEDEAAVEKPRKAIVSESKSRSESRERVVTKSKAEPPPQRPESALDKVALDYLENIAVEPFLSVRERNRDLGLSAWKAQKLKSALVDQGQVREVSVNPGGRGKLFKLLELTTAGRKALSDVGVKPRRGLGRGGVAHQWWAMTIAEWLEEQGASVVIEDDSQGARVDLFLTVSKKKVAIEIEMGESHAIENIKKDAAAGFDYVVSLVVRIARKLTHPPPRN